MTIALSAMLGATAARAAEKKAPTKIVVLDLDAKGVDAALARTATDALLAALQEVPGYKVLGRSEIKTILEYEGAKQALGCTDDSCLVDLGETLKCDLILSGSVGKIGQAYLLTARLIKVGEAAVVSRSSATALSADELPGIAAGVARELVSPGKAESTEAKTSFTLSLGEGGAKLAVLDLKASGPAKEVAENLTQVVVLELKEVKGLSIISKDEIKSMLSFEQDKQLLGCDDASCLAEIGGALGVEYLVTGNVGMMGSAYLLYLKLINIREAKVEHRVAESFEGDETQLVGAAKFAARKLLGIPQQGRGKLAVRPSVADYKLLLDGEESAAGGAEKELAAGKYNLRLEADGYYPWIGDVYVEKDRLTRMDVSMKELPEAWYEKWWLWTAVGVVVAGAVGVGTYYGLTGSGPNTGTLDVSASTPGGAR